MLWEQGLTLGGQGRLTTATGGPLPPARSRRGHLATPASDQCSPLAPPYVPGGGKVAATALENSWEFSPEIGDACLAPLQLYF